MIADTLPSQTYQSLRPYLFSVAYRMTGSASDAEDLVQDAWIRYLDAGSPAVDSLRAYLTTIVSRLSLDYLKSARVKREQYTGTWMPEPVLTAETMDGPAAAVEQRESISLALLTLMEQLTPDQRVVYVLREAFGLAYDEIAVHLGKSAAACRQVFRRAQQRMEREMPAQSTSPQEHQRMIERFMDAFVRGDIKGVASLLSEDAAWYADGGPNRLANRHGILGRDRIARGLTGLINKFYREYTSKIDLSMQIVDVNGAPSAAVFNDGQLERIISLDMSNEQVTYVRILLNPEKLAYLARALGTEPAWESPYPKPRGAS